MKVRILFYLSLCLVVGCVSYAAVGPGAMTYPGLVVETGAAWNRVPKEHMTIMRPGAETWTQDGMLLDRVMIIPGVPDGEPVFRQRSRSEALPKFEANMLPNEIQELTESTVVKLFGEGQGAVESSNLRPHSYGDRRGILFDLNIAVSDGPDYRGIAGAIVHEGKLNLIIFIAAEPYYFDKHVDAARAIIESARIVVGS